MQERSLTEHLEELRTRILRIVIIVVVGLMATFSYGDFFIEILLDPLRSFFLAESNGKIIYTGILDKILSQFQVSLWLSFVLTSPLWFYQIWKFIAPALYKNEVKVVRPFVMIGFVLFCVGVLFGHSVVLPVIIKTFAEFGVTKVDANINLKDYLILTSKLMLLAGVVFQIPNVILILRLLDIVDTKFLSINRRYVYVGFTVASAMITPPDVFTMVMLLAPLILLYELGIFISWIFIRAKKKDLTQTA